MRKKIGIFLTVFWIGLFGVQQLLSLQVQSFEKSKQWSEKVDYHHIGAYFSSNEGVTPIQIERLRTNFDKILIQNKIAGDDREYNWMDAYSSNVSSYYVLNRNNSVMQISIIGVGGDFFWFHSDWDTHKWVSGSAFSPDTKTNQVVLTASCAWELFGALDVIGREVQVGQNMYTVCGVVEDDTDFFSEEAGFNKYTIYMPYEKLQQEMPNTVITNYEIIYPEIITNYANKKVTQTMQSMGIDAIFIDKTNATTLANQWELISSLPSQFMKTRDIQFPYWENEAQGWLLILSIVSTFWGVITIILVGIALSVVRRGIKQLKKKLRKKKSKYYL